MKTKKNFQTLKTNILKLFAFVLLAVILTACGTTKVTVNKPTNGTYTEIKVTTNNPITTNTDAKPQTEVKL